MEYHLKDLELWFKKQETKVQGEAGEVVEDHNLMINVIIVEEWVIGKSKNNYYILNQTIK